jgi:type II secretory pathway pseudopilin PulG
MNARKHIPLHALPSAKQAGFTLIELLLYVAIVGTLLIAIISFTWNIVYGRVKSHVQQEVAQNMRLVAQRISDEVRNAETIYALTPTSLCLQSSDLARNPVRIYLQSNQIWIGWGGGSTTCATTTSSEPLTSSEVVATSLAFQNLSPVSLVSQHVRFAFTLESSNPSNRPEWSLSQSFASSAEVRREP